MNQLLFGVNLYTFQDTTFKICDFITARCYANTVLANVNHLRGMLDDKMSEPFAVIMMLYERAVPSVF